MDRPLFSDMLAERRRELGFSIGQASRVLRLKEEVLIAFETGDFDSIPRGGYATGMLSSYARYLGLDAREVVDTFQDDVRAYEGTERPRRRQDGGSSRRSRTASKGTRSRAPRDPERGRSSTRSSRNGAGTTSRPRDARDAYDTTRVHYRDANEVYAQEGFDEGARVSPATTRLSRPYTAHAPASAGRGYGGQASYRAGSDIQYLDPGDFGYEDDLTIGRADRSYKSASTSSGRRRTRTVSSGRSQRPSARATRDRSSGHAGNGRRQAPTTITETLGDVRERISLPFLGVVGVVIALSAVLVFSITSCIRQDSESTKSVPVSQVQEEAQTADVEDAGTESTQDDTDTLSTGDHKDNTEGRADASPIAEETSVSVSVQDGAVTWLEVECDGTSDVAETITGPWQRTYTVEDVITIQVGDTTAVTVVQNGRQVQFDSITSGIGTLRIQGTKVEDSDEDVDGDADEDGAQTGDEGLVDGSTYRPEDDVT